MSWLPHRLKNRHGVTLVELMIAAAILSIGILGFFSSFQYISKALRVSRSRTLATNLAQERVEFLKNIPYYALMLTTASATDSTVSPAILYDNGAYPPENIAIAGINFTRYTRVSLAQVDNDVITALSSNLPDTGLKQVTVNIVWSENGYKKVMTLNNLLENPNVNPLDSVITGAVNKNTGGGLDGAVVKTDENPDYNSTTDSGGLYSFKVYHGSYTVRASSTGYYSAVTTGVVASAGSSGTAPTLTLIKITTGTVAGTVWISSNLIVGQVVASTQQADKNNFIAQYIELYNPTPAAITIGGATPAIKVNFQTANTPSNCSDYTVCADSTYGIKLVYVNDTIPSHGYYLIANTTTFMVNGTQMTADAYYADDADTFCGTAPNSNLWDLGLDPPKIMLVNPGHGGTVWISDSGGNIMDAVGWSHGTKVAPNCEGTCIPFVSGGGGGLADGQQIVRIASPTASLNISDLYTYGRAYDSGDNTLDFAYPPVTVGVVVTPRMTSNSVKHPIAGVPGIGAYISTSDPYSGSTQAYAATIASGSYNLAFARYALTNVTTGTWTVEIATGSYFLLITTPTVSASGITYVPNATSTPSWPAANLPAALLTDTTNYGFIKGLVTTATNSPLSDIRISAGSAVRTTNANGLYFMSAPSGPLSVIFNQNNLNTSYVQEVYTPTLVAGQVTTLDVSLSLGGVLQGFATSGTSPLPNIIFSVQIDGNQAAAGATNSSGYFNIRNITTGTYLVQPVIDDGQSSDPETVTVVLNSTGTVFVSTFTISGALGNFSGTVTSGGNLVTTGALIVASTAPLSATLPQICGSSAPAMTPIYAVSSRADGTYSLPVRALSSYYIGVYMPTLSGTTGVTVTNHIYSTPVSANPGVVTTNNLTVP